MAVRFLPLVRAKAVKAVKAVLYVLKGGCTERRETWPQETSQASAMGAVMARVRTLPLRATWYLLAVAAA